MRREYNSRKNIIYNNLHQFVDSLAQEKSGPITIFADVNITHFNYFNENYPTGMTGMFPTAILSDPRLIGPQP
jgi:hypothetical protein